VRDRAERARSTRVAGELARREAGSIILGEVDERHLSDGGWEPSFGTSDGMRWAGAALDPPRDKDTGTECDSQKSDAVPIKLRQALVKDDLQGVEG
jgi:hypothetical protein